MTTRYSRANISNSVSSGYDNPDIVEDFSIPSCTIEDVDRALFNLFNEELPLLIKRKDELKRPPVIFATGERFALLARNRPLRDKTNALILPLVSIVRTGIDQLNAKGNGLHQGSPIVVKTRLAKKNLTENRISNTHGFKNSDDLAGAANANTDDGFGGGTDPGKIASRRTPPRIPMSTRRGTILAPSLKKAVIEYIEIPPIKQYTANYEITFWTQYTQEMNSFLTVLMSGYVENRMRTFVLETPAGYKFTAYTDAALNPQNNFDDFTDSERMVKYSFAMSVPAYTVAPQEPGMPSPYRRFQSAPNFSFDAEALPASAVPGTPPPGTVPSSDPGALIFSDLSPAGMPPVMQALGNSGGGAGGGGASAQAIAAANAARLAQGIAPLTNPSTPSGIYESLPAVANISPEQLSSGWPGDTKVVIGGTDFNNTGTTKKSTGRTTIITDVDPFTGEKIYREIIVKASNPRKGETVFRDSQTGAEGFVLDLGVLFQD
tara:strand:+ start:3568 stop:5040 length:1473 start_codon:yes stop_codon:yes gene_type:complete